MNDEYYYSGYDGSYFGIRRQRCEKRTMKQVKADFNNNLQKHSISKTKAR
jgi:hypothetical protein